MTKLSPLTEQLIHLFTKRWRAASLLSDKLKNFYLNFDNFTPQHCVSFASFSLFIARQTCSSCYFFIIFCFAFVLSFSHKLSPFSNCVVLCWKSKVQSKIFFLRNKNQFKDNNNLFPTRKLFLTQSILPLLTTFLLQLHGKSRLSGKGYAK